MVQLADDLVARLDEEARGRGLSRSALIREVLGDYLDDRARVCVGRRIAAGYQRIPPATPDEWGDVGALTDQGTVDLLTRLDAEERGAGTEPW